MKRLKSTLATVLLLSAGAAAIGLGAIMAVAAMVIGLVIAGAAKLAIAAQNPQADDAAAPAKAEVVEPDLATAS